MTSTAIRAEGLSKQYSIGERAGYLPSFRETLVEVLKSRLSGPRSVTRKERERIWALHDVSFEVNEGEVLGLVGRNGAGKSTLLKILARVTRPTKGRAELHGRIGSLLEVGTGFHPDLTGRENTFLNGAILGMAKQEISRKFDEIVAFAEIAKFIDTPVRHYSSGMYMRLAFAVAAHLEPEILLVDEVLSVGDAMFQKKCLGKMGQVSREGRTIIFVSHNMAAVRALCSRALLIEAGGIAAAGSAVEVVDEYLLGTSASESCLEWPDPASAPGNDNVRVSFIRILPPEGKATINVDTGATIEIGFENFLDGINLDCTVYVTSSEGILLFESGQIISSNEDSRRGSYCLTGTIPPNLLNAGRYTLDVLFGKDQRYVLYRVDNVACFLVENTSTGRGANMEIAPGVVRPLVNWRHSFEGRHSAVNF